MKKILLINVLCLFVIACTNQPVIDKNLEGEKLMKLSRDWSDVVNTGDLDKILEKKKELRVIFLWDSNSRS